MDKKESNKQVYHNLDIIWQNLSAFYTSVVGILLLLIVGYVGYLISAKQYSKIIKNNHHLTKMSVEQEDLTLDLQQQLNFLRVELEVEKASTVSLQADLHQYKLQNAELKKELSFYQSVMAPEMAAEGVVLEGFSIEPTLDKKRFRYKVVLVQTRKDKRFTKGHVALSIKGTENTNASILKASDLGIDTKSTEFGFRYFQIIEGELLLPNDYQAERVMISVVLPKRRGQKYSRVDLDFDWKPGTNFIE